MESIDDKIFDYLFEFYPEFKAFCDDHSIRSADDVNKCLNNKNNENNINRIRLESILHSINFMEKFSTLIFPRGVEDYALGDKEDQILIERILEDNFWIKINKIKENCKRKCIDFESLQYQSKYELFQKVLSFEDDVVKDAFNTLFQKVYWTEDNMDNTNNKITKNISDDYVEAIPGPIIEISRSEFDRIIKSSNAEQNKKVKEENAKLTKRIIEQIGDEPGGNL